tara:strand:+ start:2786 stop:3040 length:255 start_codon:yes stop_codon:yes gene_type:complete
MEISINPTIIYILVLICSGVFIAYKLFNRNKDFTLIDGLKIVGLVLFYGASGYYVLRDDTEGMISYSLSVTITLPAIYLTMYDF